MIPSIDILTKEITETTYPNRTYNVDSYTDTVVIEGASSAILGRMVLGESILGVEPPTDTIELYRINGFVDGLDAVTQAIQLILSTERYKHLIYSWDYGVELYDLVGKPMPYVMSELPRRITEALTQDNRITDVTDFEFERNGKKLHVTFTAVTNLGNIPTELEVEV